MKQEQYTLSISGGGSVGGEIMYLRYFQPDLGNV